MSEGVPTRLEDGKIAELVKVLKRSRQTVDAYIKRGMPIEDLDAAREWQRTNVRQRSGAGRAINETARLRRAQADLAELDARRRAGLLVELEDVKAAYAEALAILRLNMRGIAGRVAGPVATMTDPGEIKRYVAGEVDRSLAAAASALESWGVAPDAGEAGGDSAPAAGANAGPVGGSGPGTATG